MRRIALLVLALLTIAPAGCRPAAEPANTATGDTMSTGPSSNTATSANTDTTYTNPPAKTGTPVSATGT